MFEIDIGLLKSVLEKELGDQTEFFCDICCPDPFEEGLEFVFPIVAVHDSGLYLIQLAVGPKGRAKDTAVNAEYACKVFRSYFASKVPVRSLFVLQAANSGHRRDARSKELLVYDYHSQATRIESISCEDDLCAYIEEHVRNDGKAAETERNELVARLWREGSVAVRHNSEGSEQDKLFVKRNNRWFPALNKDSNQAYNLAVWGGFLGLHRLYLGLYVSWLVYFVTFGLFGVGWIIDCIEMLLGCWSHRGRYLFPLSNKPAQAAKLLVVLGLIGTVLYFSIYKSG